MSNVERSCPVMDRGLTLEELVAGIDSNANLPCALGPENSPLWDSCFFPQEGGGWDR